MVKPDDVEISLDAFVPGCRAASWSGPIRRVLRAKSGTEAEVLLDLLDCMRQDAALCGCNWIVGLELEIDMWPKDASDFGSIVAGVGTGAILEFVFGGQHAP